MSRRSADWVRKAIVVVLCGWASSADRVQAQAPKPPKREPTATPAASLKVAKGFAVELLYSVPKDKEGSWVNLCVDGKGRLITSDQYGSLYRVTPPAMGASADETKVEKIPADIGEAQGLLWAFDSLYVVVNKGGKYASGLYRVRDTDGDDQLDSVETLRVLKGGAEHGPHAVILSPGGKSLTIVCGNNTELTDVAASRVPRIWGEDHLLPRLPDGNGFMKDKLAPGGCIYEVDPDGKSWELLAVGFRNQFDAAYNAAGELFSYDADMEWDVNTPWYRPTRICHVVSGAEFGWRNGAGKWPAYYPDSLPAVCDIGPGSPTGVCFGYGAKFPAKYQHALFACDWSYGKLYAVHLAPKGSSYEGRAEEFVSGTPLPLTDLIVHPGDGSLYFLIGGRKTKSGLYRVRYVGDEPTAPVAPSTAGQDDRDARRRLEAYHGEPNPAAVKTAWPSLGSDDRFLRWAARTAIEHQPVEQWASRALAESDLKRAGPALLALARAAGTDPFHRPKDAPPTNVSLLLDILTALDRIDWKKLPLDARVDLLRVLQVALNRFGPPDAGVADEIITRLDPLYPSPEDRIASIEGAQILASLQSPTFVAKTVPLMEAALTQEEQLEYARAIRGVKVGWTPELRQRFFAWIQNAHRFQGGNSFKGFLKLIRNDAIATLTDAEKAELGSLLEPPAEVAPTVQPPRAFVREWKTDDVAEVTSKLTGRDFDRGRQLFAAANCYSCHRFLGEGGSVAPDLTGAAGRFSPRDLTESITEPSKVISDQYGSVTIVMTDGKTYNGRVVNLNGDNMMLMTNMLEPNNLAKLDRTQIDEIVPSTVSMMPAGLLNTLNEEEIRDLFAFLLSRGDRQHAMFAKPK